MTREELLTWLREPYPADPEADHGNAEDKLLEYLNDPEIDKAWTERRQRAGWWYA